MRAVLIDPVARKVTEVEYSGKYTHIYELLSDPDSGLNVGTFDLVMFEFDDVPHHLYVDGEGLLKDPKYFFLLAPYQQPLAGRGLILGELGDDDGPATASLDEVTRRARFAELEVTGFETTERMTDYFGTPMPFIRTSPSFKPRLKIVENES